MHVMCLMWNTCEHLCILRGGDQTSAVGSPVHTLLRYTQESSPLVKRFPRDTQIPFAYPPHGSASEACRSAASSSVCVVLSSVDQLTVEF